MIIREIAEFWIEDCQFKLADFSYFDKLPVRKLELNQQLLILAQQSETLSWVTIDMITIDSIDINSIIEQAKAYFLQKAVNCLKHDFKEHGFNDLFYKHYPKGIKGEELIAPKYVLTFGEHKGYKGMLIKDVLKVDPEYVLWGLANIATFKDQFDELVDSFYEEQEEEE